VPERLGQLTVDAGAKQGHFAEVGGVLAHASLSQVSNFQRNSCMYSTFFAQVKNLAETLAAVLQTTAWHGMPEAGERLLTGAAQEELPVFRWQSLHGCCGGDAS